jgi:hypothetical protein
MRQRPADRQPFPLIGLRLGLGLGLGLGFGLGFGLLWPGLLTAPALAASVSFSCVILPGDEIASITLTNSLAGDASCIVTCRFQRTKYNNNPQITCAKPVPAGMEVEMCRLTSGGDKMVKLREGHAECTRLPRGLN